jgi:hypothetical protein
VCHYGEWRGSIPGSPTGSKNSFLLGLLQVPELIKKRERERRKPIRKRHEIKKKGFISN